MADQRDRRGVDSPFVASFQDSPPLAPPHQAEQPHPHPRLQHQDYHQRQHPHQHQGVGGQGEVPGLRLPDPLGHKATQSRHLQMLAPPFLRRGDSAPAPPLLFRLNSLEFKQMSPSQPKSRRSQPFAASDSRHCSPRSTGVFFGNVNSNHPVNVININIALERKRSSGDEDGRRSSQGQAQPNDSPAAPSSGGRDSCCGLDLMQFLRLVLNISTVAALL